MDLLLEVERKHGFLCRGLAGKPLPLGTHDPEVPVAGHLLQSLLFHFLTPPTPLTLTPPPHPLHPTPRNLMKPQRSAIGSLERNTYSTHSAPIPHTHQLSGGSQIFLGLSLLPERLRSGGCLTATGCAWPCPEVPPSALHSVRSHQPFLRCIIRNSPIRPITTFTAEKLLEGCLLH